MSRRPRTAPPALSADTMLAELEHAADALAAGRAADALHRLLGLWRTVRASELADAIDRVGALIELDRAPLAGKTWLAGRTWEDTASADRPEDAARLLATLRDVVPRVAARRLKLLARRAPDPRVSRALAHDVAAVRFNTSTAARFYQLALELIAAHRDVRALAILPAEAPVVNARRSTLADVTLSVHLPRARDKLTAVRQPVLAPDVVARLAELAPAAVAPVDGQPTAPRFFDDLLAAVLAEPAADEPRLVLADALQDAGDPWGELIALQIARAREGGRATSREAALLKQHGRRWLARLEPFVHARGVRYERGVLVACRVSSDRPLPDSPLWSTVEELHLRGVARGAAAELVLRLPALRVVSGVDHDVAIALAEAPTPPPIDSLSVDVANPGGGQRDTLAVLGARECRLRPRRLALIRWNLLPARVAALLDTRLADRLDHLVVCAPVATIPAWLDAIGSRTSPRRTLELRATAHLDDDLVGHRFVLARSRGRVVRIDAIGPYHEVTARDRARNAAALGAARSAAQALGVAVRVVSRRQARAGGDERAPAADQP